MFGWVELGVVDPQLLSIYTHRKKVKYQEWPCPVFLIDNN
jgi:hypothetical protein